MNTELDYVVVIDCLKPAERDEISKGVLDFLAINRIVCHPFYCKDVQALFSNLKILENKAKNGDIFLIHIISHGTVNGLIEIGQNEESCSWDKLNDSFAKINQNMNGNLLLNMTTCRGLHGIKIVNIESEQDAFFGLIGCKKGLSNKKAKEINRFFYEQMLIGEPIDKIATNINLKFGDLIYCISSKGYKTIKNSLNNDKRKNN
jgi:hypothetical protein